MDGVFRNDNQPETGPAKTLPPQFRRTSPLPQQVSAPTPVAEAVFESQPSASLPLGTTTRILLRRRPRPGGLYRAAGDAAARGFRGPRARSETPLTSRRHQ